MSKKKRLWFIIGIVVLVILIIYVYTGKSGNNIIRVSTEKAALRTITETVSASGKIQPETEVKISADVSGEITELLVKEGDSVSRGQLLLRINPELYETSLQQLQASLDNARAGLSSAQAQLIRVQASFRQAEANYNRQKKLHQDKVISEQEWENAQSAYDIAKADVEATSKNILASQFTVKSLEARVEEGRRNFNRTSIYAPASGIISQLNSEKGERVVGTAQMTGTEIMRIADLSAMEVRVDVNENDIVNVKIGDSADIEVDAYGNRKFMGIVTEIGNSANFTQTQLLSDQVTNFVIKIRILPSSYSDLIGRNGQRSPFRPGMSATAKIHTQTVRNALSIPTSAVTVRNPIKSNGNGKAADNTKPKDEKKKDAEEEVPAYVFVISNGQVKAVKVKTGIQDNEHIVITEGIKEGDEIVTGPYSQVSRSLMDGDKVTVTAKEKLFTK